MMDVVEGVMAQVKSLRNDFQVMQQHQKDFLANQKQQPHQPVRVLPAESTLAQPPGGQMQQQVGQFALPYRFEPSNELSYSGSLHQLQQQFQLMQQQLLSLQPYQQAQQPYLLPAFQHHQRTINQLLSNQQSMMTPLMPLGICANGLTFEQQGNLGQLNFQRALLMRQLNALGLTDGAF
jgi:hypothetical protein